MKLFLLILSIGLAQSADWSTVTVYSDLPSARSGHSLTSYKGELYLFGGCNLDTVCYNDLQTYNATDQKWTLITTSGSQPSEREGHLAVLVGSFLYVYGGTSLTEILGDVFYLDMNLLQWNQVTLAGTADPRAYHAGVLHDHGLIFIFGGYTESGLTSEILLLDTVNQHWGHPFIIGQGPSARKDHSLNRISTKVWLFGGQTSEGITNDLWYYDLYARHWYEVTTTNYPSARHGHATIDHGNSIYLLAGCNNDKRQCYSDLYTFDTDNQDWTLALDSTALPSREAHKIEFIAGELYVFGGRYLMEQAYGDFWLYETDEPCPGDCSGNGDCADTGCSCYSGWSGSSCTIQTVCRMNCNGHGACNDFSCICYPGYYGTYCQGLVGCKNNCTSGAQGVCQDSSDCECYYGYTGDDCSLEQAWKVCQDLCTNGHCENLTCVCEPGWVGLYCDVTAPIIYNYTPTKVSVSSNNSSAQSSSSGTASSSTSSGSATSSTNNGVYQAKSISKISQGTYEISPSSAVSVNQTEFNNLTQEQTAGTETLNAQESIHYLVPQMFGLTDPDNPTSFYVENLRRIPYTEIPPSWVQDLENKQNNRQDEINKCSAYCNYHGICYSGICYCESGFTGNTCGMKVQDSSKGIKLTTAITVTVVFGLLGMGLGGYVLHNIMKKIKMKEESKIKEEEEGEEDQ
jgi:Galactose oxidase, central domain